MSWATLLKSELTGTFYVAFTFNGKRSETAMMINIGEPIESTTDIFLEDFKYKGKRKKYSLDLIPIINNDTAKAKINFLSKDKKFVPANNLFLYLAAKIDKSNLSTSLSNAYRALSRFSFAEDLYLVETYLSAKDEGNESKTMYLISKAFEMPLAGGGDFASLNSGKNALLQFPPSKYSGYNFDELVNLKEASFVITAGEINDKIFKQY